MINMSFCSLNDEVFFNITYSCHDITEILLKVVLNTINHQYTGEINTLFIIYCVHFVEIELLILGIGRFLEFKNK